MSEVSQDSPIKKYLETKIIKATAEPHTSCPSHVTLICDLEPKGRVAFILYLDRGRTISYTDGIDCHGLRIPSLQQAIDFYKESVPELEQLDKFKEVTSPHLIEAKLVPQPPVFDLASLSRPFSVENLRKAIACFDKGQPILIEMSPGVFRLLNKKGIVSHSAKGSEIDGIPVKCMYGLPEGNDYLAVCDTHLVFEDGSKLVIRTEEPDLE